MSKTPQPKKETLTTRLFITDILEKTLSIPSKKIVNDTTFNTYTGSKRPRCFLATFILIIKEQKSKK